MDATNLPPKALSRVIVEEGAGKLFKAGLGYIMRSKDSSHNKSVDQFFSWDFGLEMVQRGKSLRLTGQLA